MPIMKENVHTLVKEPCKINAWMSTLNEKIKITPLLTIGCMERVWVIDHDGNKLRYNQIIDKNKNNGNSKQIKVKKQTFTIIT